MFGINNLKFDDFFELTLDKRTRANHPSKLELNRKMQGLTPINIHSLFA